MFLLLEAWLSGRKRLRAKELRGLNPFRGSNPLASESIMFGVILVSIGSFFEEISASIGKTEVQEHKESVYTMASLALIGGFVVFLALNIFKGGFRFSLASLPTFSIRAVLEILQVYVGTMAVIKAERSTFGFLRTGTIVLLLVVDFFVGYQVDLKQMIGMSLIIFSLLLFFMNHGVKKDGLKYILLSTFGAVATISLFKYDIEHFNSVEAEQVVILGILAVFYSLMALIKEKENPLRFLMKPVFFAQSLTHGISSVFGGFAYNFGSPSVITAAGRSSSTLFSFLSGNFYFREKSFLFKFFLFLFLALGIFLLV